MKEISENKAVYNDGKNNQITSDHSNKNELKSNSFANLKFGVGKDGSLLYTYE